MRQKTFVLWVVCDEPLNSTTNLESDSQPNRSPSLPVSAQQYHSVLAHQNHAVSAQCPADLVHLLRADIVDGDDENRFVLLEEILELVEVDGFVR